MNQKEIQQTLQQPYNQKTFVTKVLKPIFDTRFTYTVSQSVSPAPTTNEKKTIGKVVMYGEIALDDGSTVTCYEITLQPQVRIEQSRVAIQQYIRKLTFVGSGALISFISPKTPDVWRLTFIAKDSELTDKGAKILTTHAKRYTYLLGKSEACKTIMERLTKLGNSPAMNFAGFIEAFSVEKLGREFFKEYVAHYKKFVDSLSASKACLPVFKGDEKTIQDFCKKLLGRVVFLYFVQKKGWLGASDLAYKDGNPNFITHLFDTAQAGDAFYALWLSKLFFEVLNQERKDDNFTMPDGSVVKIPFLNGGLFEKEDIDTHTLTIDATLFRASNLFEVEIPQKRGFLDFLNAYNFTVYEDSPDDHTVAVDPEMLGNIFESLLGNNKETGTYYTPKEVVHYICQDSLIEYLKRHIFPELIEHKPQNAHIRGAMELLVRDKQISVMALSHAERIDDLLDSVKICDPAIGSGAFPMGLLQEIFAVKEFLAYQTGKEWKPAEVKANIIQNSIYGVDTEKGAVDIARLRFWLSLVVDEDMPKPLPNLDYKIVVGDSLLSKFGNEIVMIEWDNKKTTTSSKKFVQNIQQLLGEVSEKQKNYFTASPEKKKTLRQDIRTLKIELLTNQITLNKTRYEQATTHHAGFQVSKKQATENAERAQKIEDFDKLLHKLQSLKANPESPLLYFDWKLAFPDILNPHLVGEQGGFDIIVGNPPYFNIQTWGAKSIDAEHIRQQYADIWMDKSDILFFFIRKAIELAKERGCIQYIISNAFLFSDKAQRLRNIIIQQAPIQAIVNFEKYMVFESAMITTAIVRLEKGATQRTARALVLNEASPTDFAKAIRDETRYTEVQLYPDQPFALVSNEIETLNARIDERGTPLGDLLKVGKGMETAANEVFSNENLASLGFPAEFMRKRLNGKAIKRYAIDKRYVDDMLYFENVATFEELPDAIQSYLAKNINSLKDRATVKNEGRVWWRYSRPMHKELYNLDKIWTSYRGAQNCFAFDDTQKYIGLTNTTVIFNTNPAVVSLKYVLALLNSELLNFRYKSIGKQTGGGIFEYFENQVSKLPIVVTDNQEPFVRLVEYVMWLKAHEDLPVNEYVSNAHIAGQFEEVLDAMVFELYFEEEVREKGADVIQYVARDFQPLPTDATLEASQAHLGEMYQRLRVSESTVRNQVMRQFLTVESVQIINKAKK